MNTELDRKCVFFEKATFEDTFLLLSPILLQLLLIDDTVSSIEITYCINKE